MFACYLISYNTVFLNLPNIPGNKFTNGMMFGLAELTGILVSNKIIKRVYEDKVYMFGAIIAGSSSAA
jgi:uncharacterized membrane protein (DUF485 family)